MKLSDYSSEGLPNGYTTRRLDEVIRFIEMLPFEEETIIELKS